MAEKCMVCGETKAAAETLNPCCACTDALVEAAGEIIDHLEGNAPSFAEWLRLMEEENEIECVRHELAVELVDCPLVRELISLRNPMPKEAEKTPKKVLPKWAREFGQEYCVPPGIALEYQDISWGNDIAPSFLIFEHDEDNWARIWVEHPNPQMREMDGMARYTVSVTTDAGNFDAASTDDLDECMRVAAIIKRVYHVGR